MRMVAFAIFPLLSSVRLLRRKRQKLDRESLKLPFYSQCYATAPMALLFGLAATWEQVKVPWAPLVAVALMGVGVVWFLVVETGWFRSELQISRIRAFGNAVRIYVESLLILLALSWAFSGS